MKKHYAKIKRPLWVAGLNIALALTVGSTQAFADTPITNQTQLEAIGTDLAGSYVVTGSFGVVAPVSGDSTYVTGTFTGTFDGGGFTISGLTKPLFDVIDGDESSPDTTISDLTLVAAPVEGNPAVGGVTGQGILANDSIVGTVIDNVHVSGEVNGSGLGTTGGLVGANGGTISNSSAIGNVGGTNDVGGLVGANGGTISNSYATGDVTASESYVGGLVGYSGGTITNSYATGDVDGTYMVGGLVGYSSGTITNSYANIDGDVIGTELYVGGLAGYAQDITNSYAIVSGDVSGDRDVGGLVGGVGTISNSYAVVGGNVIGTNAWSSANTMAGGLVGGLAGSAVDINNSYVDVGESVDASFLDWGGNPIGGLVGQSYGVINNSSASIGLDVASNSISGGLAGYTSGPITNSQVTVGRAIVGDIAGGLVGYADTGAEISNSNSSVTGNITGVSNTGDLVAYDPAEIPISESTGTVNGDASGINPLTATELLVILNTGSVSPIFALNANINSGRPYLISNAPPGNDGGNDDVVEASIRIDFSSFIPTQALASLGKSVGFEAAKSDLNKLDIAFLDQVKGEKSAPITGAKLFTNQSLTTSLSIGGLLQLEINFEANESLQMWVKSSEGQYVLVGDVTFDKDGNAVLPGIEFKKSGSYEFIFVNSEKKDLAQPELVNKVIGLTVYVN